MFKHGDSGQRPLCLASEVPACHLMTSHAVQPARSLQHLGHCISAEQNGLGLLFSKCTAAWWRQIAGGIDQAGKAHDPAQAPFQHKKHTLLLWHLRQT